MLSVGGYLSDLVASQRRRVMAVSRGYAAVLSASVPASLEFEGLRPTSTLIFPTTFPTTQA